MDRVVRTTETGDKAALEHPTDEAEWPERIAARPSLLRQIAGYAPAVSAGALSSFAVMYIFTRVLSPEEYGRLALTLSVVFLAHSLGFAWLRCAIIRFYEIARRDGQFDTLLATVSYAAIATAGSIAAIYAVLVVTIVHDTALREVLWLGIPLFLLKSAAQISQGYRAAAAQTSRYAAFECGQSLIGLTAGLMLGYWFGFGAKGLIAGMSLGPAVLLAWYLPQTLREYGTHWRIDREFLSVFLRYGLPIACASAMEFITDQSDRFLLGYFFSVSAVGLYAVGAGLAQQVMSLLFAAVANAALPMAVHALERHGKESAADRLYANGVLLLSLTIPACLGMMLCTTHIARVLIGREFQDGVIMVLPWIALGAFLGGINVHYFAHVLYLNRSTASTFVIHAAGALVSISANLLLIPVYGIIAPALGYIATQAVMIACYYWWGRRSFPVRFPIRTTAQALIASVPMIVVLGIVTFPISMGGLLVKIASGALIYAGAGFILDLANVRTRLCRGGWLPFHCLHR
jgi:O-antigen/teichoic acid export membrane protein